ncbi:alpha/beta hydrolase [Limnohabitans sp. 2KL-1]|uniref:alpha/beta fold hydrolase n=1 Tax=Limnohabitans sp. 2KL-1 TaxID=1100699 RepID=UPI000D382AC3|nr:alpha/beta hydrolase [Limnohabitans sp. 2KL-1]PUE50566.1 alpha/beta hydrolase [Limnohabitans sp. 2KL-1]
MQYQHTSIWRHLFRMPFKLGWVDAGGVSTRYLEAGPPDAPALVLLHGTAGSLENFCANYAEYAKHFRVIGIDMLGCGWTDKPAFDYQIKDYAAHVGAVMDALALRQAAVVGVSLGSWVGAWLALESPGRVTKLVMVAPAGIVTDPVAEQKFAEGVRQRRSQAAAAPSWESVAAAMKGLVLDPESLMDELVALRLDIYSDPRMKEAMPRLLAFTLGGQALSLEQWRSLRLPIQVFAAVDAPNMFLGNARAIAETAPHAELFEIKGCDHWAQYEQPETFNKASIAFLLNP